MSTATKDDPRDSSLEASFRLPSTWKKDEYDGLGTSGMFLSGLIMVTRNRVIAWPTTLFGINQVITTHPLRNKEGGNGWTNLVLCLSALVAAYAPLFVVTKDVQRP